MELDLRYSEGKLRDLILEIFNNFIGEMLFELSFFKFWKIFY